MKDSLKIIDLFCGAGGLSLGFEKAGFESILAIDMWPQAIETFNYNRKNNPVGIVADISKINDNFVKEKIGKKINGIVGGPPCQGFSLAGKRSVSDIRNQLYKDYFRVLKTINPDFFVMENVSGILNLDDGNFKNDIMLQSQEAGYDIYYKKLLASDYGVPQNRVRVFFVGIKKELNKGEFRFPKKVDKKISCEEALSDLPLFHESPRATEYASKSNNDYQKEMRKSSKVVYNHENTNHTDITRSLIKLIPEGGSIKSLSPELRGNRKYDSLLRRMKRNEPSNTIDTGHRTYFHYAEDRIISVRESARLQSFPDHYFFTGAKQSQYKQVGNAVPPKLAEKVAESIIDYLYK